MNAFAAARRAEGLGARLPPLLVAAERVAATVAQGVHGRRRVGQGDSFWQFRPFLPGDDARRIDWRQSARSDRAFVRETEWEAAQTVALWRDGGPSMCWRRDGPSEKIERADLLLLALAALLLRGGERVRLLHAAQGQRSVTGLDRLAEQLGQAGDEPLGAAAEVPRHSQVVLFGDFLAPLADIQRDIGRLAAIPVRGHLVQILDPAEALLPYEGRVRFEALNRQTSTLIARVESVRGEYAKRLAEQQDGLRGICRAANWNLTLHVTDHPPEAALLALYAALSPERRR